MHTRKYTNESFQKAKMDVVLVVCTLKLTALTTITWQLS
jgi:hypothetical protein